MATTRINMKMKLFIGIILSSLILCMAPSAYAKTTIVQGSIDTSNPLLIGSTVAFKDTTSHQVTATTTVRPNGTYYLSLPEGTYDISLIPPAESGLPQTTKYNQQIATNTISDFVTSPQNTQRMKRKGWNPLIGIALSLVILGGLGYFVWKRK